MYKKSGWKYAFYFTGFNQFRYFQSRWMNFLRSSVIPFHCHFIDVFLLMHECIHLISFLRAYTQNVVIAFSFQSITLRTSLQLYTLPEILSGWGWTTLHFFLSWLKSVSILMLFLCHGGDANPEDSYEKQGSSKSKLISDI